MGGGRGAGDGWRAAGVVRAAPLRSRATRRAGRGPVGGRGAARYRSAPSTNTSNEGAARVALVDGEDEAEALAAHPQKVRRWPRRARSALGEVGERRVELRPSSSARARSSFACAARAACACAACASRGAAPCAPSRGPRAAAPRPRAAFGAPPLQVLLLPPSPRARPSGAEVSCPSTARRRRRVVDRLLPPRRPRGNWRAPPSPPPRAPRSSSRSRHLRKRAVVTGQAIGFEPKASSTAGAQFLVDLLQIRD